MAEGSFFLGAVGAAFCILRVPLPGWAVAACAIAFGAVVGSLVCAIPGLLRARFGASELVSSLMLNYAALFIGLYDVPAELVGIIQALVILFATAALIRQNPRLLAWLRRRPASAA